MLYQPRLFISRLGQRFQGFRVLCGLALLLRLQPIALRSQRCLFLFQLCPGILQRRQLLVLLLYQPRLFVPCLGQCLEFAFGFLAPFDIGSPRTRFVQTGIFGVPAQLVDVTLFRVAEFGIRRQQVEHGFRFQQLARFMQAKCQPFQAEMARVVFVSKKRCLCRCLGIPLQQVTGKCRVSVGPHNLRQRRRKQQRANPRETVFFVNGCDLVEFLAAQGLGRHLFARLTPGSKQFSRHAQDVSRLVRRVNQDVAQLRIQIFP